MSGHSKWSNIKHKKLLTDKKKGKVFTKLIREIQVAAKLFGPDKDSNPRLRSAINNALNNNMNKTVIERTIDFIREKCKNKNDSSIGKTTYEGYGPFGIAFIIKCIPDNLNKNVAEIRHIFSRFDGKLGSRGSVSYMFNSEYLISFNLEDYKDKNFLINAAIQVNAKDILEKNNVISFIASSENIVEAKKYLKKIGLNKYCLKFLMSPNIIIKIKDPEKIEKINNITNELKNLTCVDNVYNNLESISEPK